jgi:PPP family 3-phenylpropionic acid transporter
VYYIFYFAAMGIYIPFLPLFLSHSNLDSMEIGFLMSVGPFVGIFAQAVWGTQADRRRRHKEFLIVALTLTALICIFLSYAKGFISFAVLLLLYAFTNSPITPLSDALVLNTLEDRRNYGKIRRWGSFGFALTAALGGLIFTYIDLAWFGIVEGIVLFGCLFWAKSLPNPRKKMQAGSSLPALPSSLLNVLKVPSLLVFFMVTFLFMTPYNAYTAFFGWHMQELGASRWWIGFGWTIAGLSEMLVFSLGNISLRWFTPQQLMILAGAIFAFRWIEYSRVQDFRIIILLQITQCLSFALFYLAGVEYLNSLLPTYVQGSAQAAFNAVSFGISAIVGTFGAGWLVRVGDVQLMYRVAASLTAVGIILVVCFLKKARITT